jgi:hypothetical protein
MFFNECDLKLVSTFFLQGIGERNGCSKARQASSNDADLHGFLEGMDSNDGNESRELSQIRKNSQRLGAVCVEIVDCCRLFQFLRDLKIEPVACAVLSVCRCVNDDDHDHHHDNMMTNE